MSQIDRAFAALSDPTRRAILARLATGEAEVGELARLTGVSQPAVSRHLAVLERAGFVSSRVDAQRRPRSLNPGALAPVRDWLADVQAAFEANYSRLDALLAAMPDERPTPEEES